MSSGAGALLVIPARLHSTRLPRKALLSETGKPLIQHVWEAAAQVRRADAAIVATDHEEIFAVVQAFGGRVEMTDPGHRSGSDRVAEVAARHEFEIVINLQGDEPELDPADVERLIEVLQTEPEVELATLVVQHIGEAEQADPSVVKAVIQDGWAVDFLREPTPGAAGHVGVYGFRAPFLQSFTALAPTARELERRLEQMRALDHGYRIRAVPAGRRVRGIDTPEDYAAFVRRVRGS
ncbi:MAG: 3-deoxy-manno-octulosonate cytidylyltransferase [Planctomycetota bacterium]|nr:3-deoxy-manno-octulosonate cytidylyltransferase [Planctomycetota bacterium]